MNTKQDPIHWSPRSWDQVLGCRPIIEHYQDMVRGVRIGNRRSGYNTLLTGRSRTGKTGITSFAIRCLTCQALDLRTLTPCPGTCEPCRSSMALHGHAGYSNCMDLYDSTVGGTTLIQFHCVWVDCAHVTAAELDRIFEVSRGGGEHLLVIIYFDEVHNLVKKDLDDRLLTPTEKHRAIWIASSAYIRTEAVPDRFRRQLEEMLQNRFAERLETTLPTVDELIGWLVDRCVESGIVVDDPEATLTLLARRARQVPGLTLEVLSKAWKREAHLLTRSMVEQHVFNFDRDDVF